MLDLLLLSKILLGLLLALGVRMALRANEAADRLMPVIEVPGNDCDPQPLRFDGSAAGYYRIWLHSLLLTLLTLGLYGPWGKVRQYKYLYGRTAVGRRRFSYLGDPWALFLARLLRLVGLAILALLPDESVVGALAAIVLIPWVLAPLMLHLWMRFGAQSAALGGVPVAFNGSFAECWRVHAIDLVGMTLTLGLGFPCFLRRTLVYFSSHLRWGQHRIRVDVPLGELFMATVGGLLAALPPLLLGAVCVYALSPDLVQWLTQNADEAQAHAADLALPVLALVGALTASLLPAYRVFRALVLRAVLADFAIDGVGRLVCGLSDVRAAWVAWWHAWACMLSLGLLIPWARVRWLQLVTDHVVLLALPPETLREASPAPAPVMQAMPAATIGGRSSAPIPFEL